MYNNNNNSSHHDPYAGQYPPPPPLQSPVAEQPTMNNSYPAFSTPLQQEVYVPPPTHHQDVYMPPHTQQEAYIPPANDYYNHSNDYYERTDTGQTSLDAYLRQEREEYLKNESKPQDTIPLNQDPEKAPMLENQNKASDYQPYLAKPTVAPQNEAAGYQYTPYEPKKNRSCNCCCYNPAITCCSFFMLLISIAFCVAGIALIIASKVISSKCDNSCSGVSDRVASACDTICNTVLQNGLFYGGIVVAALAGIAIIWKLVMWTCAGYSQRH